jgi:hypothetical protein
MKRNEMRYLLLLLLFSCTKKISNCDKWRGMVDGSIKVDFTKTRRYMCNVFPDVCIIRHCKGKR